MACTSGKALGLPLRFDQNVERAHDERFCAQGEIKACASLGFILMHGKGIGVDLKGAREPLRAACMGGEKYGCRDLAKLLLHLEAAPTAAETAEGVDAETRAAGCRQLAVSYNTGKGGVARDQGRAAELFARACAMGEREICPVVAKVTNEAGAAARAKVKPILEAACQTQVIEACEAGTSLQGR